MNLKTTLVLITWFLTMPFLAGQAALVKLPSSALGGGANCDRAGELLGRDVFAQTFVLRQDDGLRETVPFSRWTKFFKISPDSGAGVPRAIEPTDIRLGDRLCVLLDPSEAAAALILVLKDARLPVRIAAGPTLGSVALIDRRR